MNIYYYEVHVTFSPVVDDEHLADVASSLEVEGFRMAKLVLRNGNPYVDDCFCTTRTALIEDAKSRVIAANAVLKSYSVEMRRYKVEAVVIDSNQYDGLNLLPA